jgi:hypothetical protein
MYIIFWQEPARQNLRWQSIDTFVCSLHNQNNFIINLKNKLASKKWMASSPFSRLRVAIRELAENWGQVYFVGIIIIKVV